MIQCFTSPGGQCPCPYLVGVGMEKSKKNKRPFQEGNLSKCRTGKLYRKTCCERGYSILDDDILLPLVRGANLAYHDKVTSKPNMKFSKPLGLHTWSLLGIWKTWNQSIKNGAFRKRILYEHTWCRTDNSSYEGAAPPLWEGPAGSRCSAETPLFCSSAAAEWSIGGQLLSCRRHLQSWQHPPCCWNLRTTPHNFTLCKVSPTEFKN